MKLLVTGDWHLDAQRPENRTDDYFQSQYEKVKWIYNLARDEQCCGILQPGDLFNSHRANDLIKQLYIGYFRSRTMPEDDIILPPYLYTIFGQHDLRFHSSNKDNTPLRVLEAAGVCTTLDSDPIGIHDAMETIYLYGMNWGEEIPEISSDPAVHILLLHKLILEDTEGWEKNYISVDNVFRFCKHQIIVCGDNHQSFMREKNGRMLFNCGSLMRNRIDQKDHKPVVYVVDTYEQSYKAHYIPIKPFDEVMDVKKAEQRKERNEELEAFVSKLSGDVNIEGLDFVKNIEAYMEDNPVPGSVKDFVEEMLSCET